MNRPQQTDELQGQRNMREWAHVQRRLATVPLAMVLPSVQIYHILLVSQDPRNPAVVFILHLHSWFLSWEGESLRERGCRYVLSYLATRCLGRDGPDNDRKVSRKEKRIWRISEEGKLTFKLAPPHFLCPFQTPLPSPDTLFNPGLVDVVHQVSDRVSPPPPPGSGGHRWPLGYEPGNEHWGTLVKPVYVGSPGRRPFLGGPLSPISYIPWPCNGLTGPKGL